MSGGVSSNLSLRGKLDKQRGIEVFYPPLSLCTDNGAMIALAGHERFTQAKLDFTFDVKPRWPLTSLSLITEV